MAWLLPALVGLAAGVVGGWFTHLLSLRRDREERRRERIVAHLIEAYRNLENAAGHSLLTEDQKRSVESSIAAVFLFGDKDAVAVAAALCDNVAGNGGGDMFPLLKVLRNDLRVELGLSKNDDDPKILRFE